MNYELAKKLKDAGFPQDENGSGYWYTKDSKVTYLSEKIEIPDKCYIPTLSELIEACGKKFGSLTQSQKETTIFKWKASDIEGKIGFLAHTPEEAVANLWLELNKNA